METDFATSVPASTIRSRRLRKRRERGIKMTTNLEVFENGIDLLVRNGLLEAAQRDNRSAVAGALSDALERWASGNGAKIRPQMN
jgi:hypothetical protein